MTDRRPSGIAPTRVGFRGIPFDVDVAAELEVHRRVMRNVRRVTTVVVVLLAGLAIGLAIAGKPDTATNIALYTWPFALMLLISASVSLRMRRRAGTRRS